MSIWEVLKQKLNPCVKEAEENYTFASKELIQEFTKVASDLGLTTEETKSNLNKLEDAFKRK